MSKQKTEYATLPIASLKLDPANARKHSDENLAAIMGSFRQFGQQKPIVVTRDHIVIAGNGSIEAAKKLGWTHIQVRYTDLSGDAAKAFALADNRTAELAQWDKPLLGQQLQELMDNGFDIGDIGFDAKDWLKDIVPNPSFDDAAADEIPDSAPTRVLRGQIWKLGNHRLMCGDSTKIEDVRRLFKDAKASLCFTSPPYADQRTYNGDKELSTEALARFIPAAADMCELYAVNLGLSRRDHEIQQYWDDYIKQAKSAGLKLLSWNVWDRSGFGYTIGQATAMFAIDHEFIFVFGKKAFKLNRTLENKQQGLKNKGTRREADGSTKPVMTETGTHRQLGTVIRTDLARYVGDDHKHPAMFPVALPSSYIEACTNVGEYVYEPFCGSGTTLVACEKLGRKGLGMELDPNYCDIILSRWEKLTGQKAELLN